jgi:hypothetical protein
MLCAVLHDEDFESDSVSGAQTTFHTIKSINLKFLKQRVRLDFRTHKNFRSRTGNRFKQQCRIKNKENETTDRHR